MQGSRIYPNENLTFMWDFFYVIGYSLRNLKMVGVHWLWAHPYTTILNPSEGVIGKEEGNLWMIG